MWSFKTRLGHFLIKYSKVVPWLGSSPGWVRQFTLTVPLSNEYRRVYSLGAGGGGGNHAMN